MSNNKKKYTFEDWLEYKNGTGSPLKLTDDKTTILKISNARKKAWDWAIQNRINGSKFSARHKIEKGFVNDPLNWLRLEIQKAESFIDDNPDLELQWEQGYGYLTKQLQKIDGEFYKVAKKCYERSAEGSHIDPWSLVDWERPPIANMYIYKEYLPYLKELRSTYNNYKSTNEKKSNLPDPHEVAKQFYNKPNNRRKKFRPNEIEPVMKATREYIINNDISSIDGHVNSIVDKKRFYGTTNTQREWIKYYAERALKSNEA